MKEQVISVSMTLNTKGFSEGLSLTSKQATTLGKQIASALTVDSKSAVSAVKAVKDELAKVPAVSKAVKDSIRDALNIPTTQTNKNIQSIITQMGVLKTRADSTATSMRSIKFVIGDTNANIQSVINKLTTLEKKAKSIGTVTVGIQQTGSTAASGGGSVSNVARARSRGVAAGPDNPTYSVNVEDAKKEAKIVGDARMYENAKASAMIYEQRKKEFAAERALLTGHASGLDKVMAESESNRLKATQKSTQQQAQVLSAGAQASKRAVTSQFSTLPKELGELADKATSQFSSYFSASFFGNLAANAVGKLFEAFKDWSTDAVIYAARTQELGVALNSLARVNGISTQSIIEQEVAIKRLNITTQDTRETLARFINVGFDIQKASPLARVAQDLAVIGNKSTSEELNQLTVAIQTLQSRNLRSAGVFLTVDEILDKLSATTGRARDSFTTLEKQQAVLNAVLEYGTKVSGTYDAAMGTVSKRMRSLERNFREAQNAIGESFIPALALAVDSATYLLQAVAKYPQTFLGAISVITAFGASLAVLNTQLVPGLLGTAIKAWDSFKETLNTVTGTSYNTMQAERNALLVQETQQKMGQLELERLLAVQAAEKAASEAVYADLVAAENRTLEQQILIQRKTIAQNEVKAATTAVTTAEATIASGGAASGGAVASITAGLGTIMIAATAVLAVFMGIRAFFEWYRSYKDLTNLDTSAAAKNAEDLNKLSENRRKLEQATNGEMTSQVEVLKLTEEVYSDLDITLKARLVSELGVVNAGTNRLILAQKELNILDEQRAVLEEIKKAKIVEGTTNLENAISNLEQANKVNGMLAKSLNTANSIKNTPSYIDRALKLTEYMGSAPIGKFAASYIDPTGYAANNPNDFEFVKTQAAKAGEDVEKFKAQVKSAADDLQKLAKVYGEPDVNKFVINQYKVSDAFRQSVESGTAFTGVLTEQDAKAKLLIDTLDELQARQSREAVTASKGTLAERVGGFGTSFEVEKETFVRNSKKELERLQDLERAANGDKATAKYVDITKSGDERYNTEEGQKLIQRAKNLFSAGVVAKESFDQYKKDLEQAVTSEFVQRFADNTGKIRENLITTSDVFTAYDEVVAKSHKTVDEYTKGGTISIEEATKGLSDNDKASLKAAQGTLELTDALENYAKQGHIAKTVSEAMEEKILKMTKALFDAKNAYNDFFNRSQQLLGEDIQAQALNKVTGLGQSFAKGAGEVGYTPAEISYVNNQVKGMSLDDAVAYLEANNKLIDLKKTGLELDKESARLVDPTLQAFERDVALKEARNGTMKTANDLENAYAVLQDASIQKEVIANKLTEAGNSALQQSYDIEATREILHNAEIQKQIKINKLGEARNSALQSLYDAQSQGQIFRDKETQDLVTQEKLQQTRNSVIEEQLNIENDIAQLKLRVTLPVINSQLLAEKAVLGIIQERRNEEQQLTADIAVEIAKRKGFESNSGATVSRIAGQVFLDKQRSEQAAKEDLIKTSLQSDLASGNTSIFSDNNFIKEAQRQSEKLSKIDEQGGKQVVAQLDGNELTATGNEYLKGQILSTDNVTKSVYSVQDVISKGNLDILSVLEEISSKTGIGGGNYGDFTSNSDKGKLIAATAKNVGMSPATLAGIIDYESSGDPTRTNKYGYAGLIQFSPDLQKKWGVGAQTSFADQMPFIERYFKERGYRPGMSDTQAYATVLGGNPYANLNKADANGTTPLSGITAQRARMGRVLAKYDFVSTSSGSRREVETKDILGDIEKKRAADALKNKKQKDADEAKKQQELNTYYDKLGQTYLGRKLVGELEIDAVKEYIKTVQERTDSIKKQELARELAERDPATARKLAYREARQERLNFVSKETTGAGSEERRAQKEALMAEGFNLKFRGGVDYIKALEDFDISKWQEFVDLQKESLKLELESQFRRTKGAEYASRQLQKFNNEQLSSMQQLEDRETQLQLRKAAFADPSSRFNANIIRNEKLARDESRQTVEEEIASLRRYQSEYMDSSQQRLDLERANLRDRLKAHQETLDQIKALELDTLHASEGEADRVAKKRAELDNAEARRHGDLLEAQLQAEYDYRRKLEGFNPEEFRLATMQKITGAMKSQTELMSGLFSDSFDAINSGFGGLVDKMTAKMGIFGSTVGNLLKGIFANITGQISKSLLGAFGLGGASSTGDLLGEALGLPTAKSGENPAAKAATDLLTQVTGVNVDANATAASSVLQLANAAAAAAQALLSIAGQAGQTALTIGGLVNTGLARVGLGGGSFSGVKSVNGAGKSGPNFSSLFNRVTGGSNAIAGAASNGIDSIGASASSAIAGASTAPYNPFPVFNSLPSLGQLPSIGIGGVRGGGGVGGLFGSGSIGGSLLASVPMIGASLGGMLGGGSGAGGMLGQVGGLLGGVAGLGALASLGIGGASLFGVGAAGLGGSAAVTGVGGLFGAGGLLGGLGGVFGGIGGAFGASGAAAAALGATVVLAPVAAALLVGAYFLGRNAKRKKEEKIRNQAMLDALPALEELLKGVRTDKIDGDEALTKAGEIRQKYLDDMNKLTDKKTRNIALKDVSRLDAVIHEIKIAAQNQKVRKERDNRIVPTYATGGMSGGGYIRVSQGEGLFVPHSAGNYSASSLVGAGIPGFAGGGTYAGARIRGNFDGKDNILVNVPKGTVIANPRQMSKVRQAPRFATGGVFGGSGSSTAQGAIMVQPPSVTAIVVFSQEDAERLGAQIPNSVIVSKVRHHVQNNGTSGLVGDILNEAGRG